MKKDRHAAFKTKKSLGQHFLNSPIVPAWMCDAAALTAGDTVLEIGPGTGALTKELLARNVTVCAVEADARAIASLTETCKDAIANNQLRIIHGDMRELTAEAVAKTFGLRDRQYTLVANIPYYVTGLLFRTFLETTCQPRQLVFLVQREIAARIARSHKESLLSLSVKAFGTPIYVRTVAKGHFTPPPNVESAIIAVTDISREQFANDAEKALFFKLIHLGFAKKRKQLLSNMSQAYDRELLTKVFTEMNLSLTVRAEDVPLATWHTLVHRLLNS